MSAAGLLSPAHGQRWVTVRTVCTADGPAAYSFITSILLTAVAVATAGLAIEGPLTLSPSDPRPSAG